MINAFGVGGNNAEVLREYFSTFKVGSDNIIEAQKSFLKGNSPTTVLTHNEMKYLNPILYLGYENNLESGGIAFLEGYDGRIRIKYENQEKTAKDREIAEWLFPDVYEGIGGGEVYTLDRDRKEKHPKLKKGLTLLLAGSLLGLTGCISQDNSDNHGSTDSSHAPSIGSPTNNVEKPNVIVLAAQENISKLDNPAKYIFGDYDSVCSHNENYREWHEDTLKFNEAVLQYTNAERIKAGLKPLRLNESLSKFAQGYTDEMLEKEYYHKDHTDFEGRNLRERAEEGKLPLEKGLAENLGATVTSHLNGPYTYGPEMAEEDQELRDMPIEDAKKRVQEWMNSSGHRSNILNPNNTEIGIGVSFYQRGSAYGYYLCVQDFW